MLWWINSCVGIEKIILRFVCFFCQKLLIQEKAAQEVKLAIKPFYQNKDITKEEYKEIVRKAVDKVSYEMRMFPLRLAWDFLAVWEQLVVAGRDNRKSRNTFLHSHEAVHGLELLTVWKSSAGIGKQLFVMFCCFPKLLPDAETPGGAGRTNSVYGWLTAAISSLSFSLQLL